MERRYLLRVSRVAMWELLFGEAIALRSISDMKWNRTESSKTWRWGARAGIIAVRSGQEEESKGDWARQGMGAVADIHRVPRQS